MAKILVINEPFVKDFCRTQRWAARTRGRVLRPPDWLAYATAVLEHSGHDVRLYDFPAMGWDKKKLAAIIRDEKPDAVVLDSTTPSIFSDIDCARIVKANSAAKVIMVGPHVSALPEETLRSGAGAVDVACLGEYDHTVRDVVDHLGDLASVPGIVYAEGPHILRTGSRPLIEDLDILPFPAWRHLDLKRYFDGGKLYPYLDLISGRGCPNRCSFCLWPQVMHGTRYRFRSPRNVVDEIEQDLKLFPALKRGEFFFEDDTFTADKDRAVRICEEILRRGLKITFSVNARADTADREMFKIMKRAGCRELLVGFESGVPSVLEGCRKGITPEKSRDFMTQARLSGLVVHGCFVIGLPGETERTAQQTLEFASSLGCETLQFSGAVPFPGTDFFQDAEKNGWLKTRDWSRWLAGGEQAGIVAYPGISEARINHYVDKGLRDFYLRPVFMLKFLFSTRSGSDLYRKLRGAWNFLGYSLGRSVNRRVRK